MKKFRIASLSALVLAGMMGGASVQAQDGNDEKLKELERAMRASAPASTPEIGTTTKGKPRTRAIVFDSEPQAAPPVAAAPAAPAAEKDCSALPPNAPAVSVDFTISFNVGSATVSPSSENTLNQISKVLALNPSSCIIVEGHTDASGNADKNMVLSRDRAASVVNYVSDRGGIEKKRLIPVGKGSSDPVKNLDARDPKNRRVVFKVVS